MFSSFSEHDPKIRIIIISGVLRPRMVEDLKETWAKGFMKKSFDMSRMIEKIRKIVDTFCLSNDVMLNTPYITISSPIGFWGSMFSTKTGLMVHLLTT